MKGIGLRRGRRRIGSRNIKVDDDGFLAAAYHHGFHRFVAAGIQFLVWHVRRHIDEVARPGFVDEFEPFAQRKRARPFTT